MSKLKKRFSLLMKDSLKASPVLYTKYYYSKIYRKSINLKDPKGFSQKVLWLNLYYQHPLLIQCADKYKLREYVDMLGLNHLLPTLYGVWEESSQINWDTLPEKFALKCNHGCGFNILCTDKNQLDKQQARIQLNQWLKINYRYAACEMHYSKIKPLIICEEYLENKNKFLPDDYKIYCFNGEPKVVLVCTDRIPNVSFTREFYDLNWNVLDIGNTPNEQKVKKPECLNEMIEYARILSAPFPFVRVDFYQIDSKPVLGEFTFTPGGGFATFHSKEGDQYLGDFLTLPPKYKGN